MSTDFDTNLPFRVKPTSEMVVETIRLFYGSKQNITQRKGLCE